MANKKIVVLKLRELIYTGIFLFFGILLVLLLVAMFSGKKAKNQGSGSTGAGTANPGSTETGTSNSGNTGAETIGSSRSDSNQSQPNNPATSDSDSAATVFRPGVYTTDFTLGGNTLTLQLLVDADRVKAVNLLSLEADDSEEYIETMYPLMQPALEVIESSLTEGIAPSEITFGVENQYTGTLLLQAVEGLLEKAQASTP